MVAKELADDCKKRGINCIDAPVSGGVPAAEAGTLTFMVGGEEENYKKAETCLKAMGTNVFHVGSSGCG